MIIKSDCILVIIPIVKRIAEKTVIAFLCFCCSTLSIITKNAVKIKSADTDVYCINSNSDGYKMLINKMYNT